jgi:hypothetical protein
MELLCPAFKYSTNSTNHARGPSGTPVAHGGTEAKRRTVMLRITIHDRAPMTSFVLEGKLIGPWVKELNQCWQNAVADDPSTSMLVDLAAVTFIDCDGRALLRQMRRQGVRLLSHGVLIDAIVAEIEAGDRKQSEETTSGY